MSTHNEVVIPCGVREKMSTEMARLYYEEVLACKNGLITSISRTIDRGYTLLGISLTIASASVAWLSQDGRWAAFGALLVSIAVILMLMLNVTKTHVFHLEGNSPKEMDIEKFVIYYRDDCHYGKSDTYLHLLCDQIDLMNDDIRVNREVMNTIIRWYRWCIHTYIFGLVAVVLIWVLTQTSLFSCVFLMLSR